MQLVKPIDLILRKVCRADFTVSLTTIQQMFDLLREVRGLGLAAPQVGIDARLFITEWGEVFINARIVRINGAIHVTESCLSLPGFTAGVDRWNHIRLADGRVYNGTRALVVQHEIDHLDGILITDFPRRRNSITRSHPMKRLFLLTALILCLASCSRETAPPKPASRPYDAGLRDGSVIFWRGGLLVKPILKHNRGRWGAPRPRIGAQHPIGVKAVGVKGIKIAGGQIRGRFASRRSERFAAARLASPAQCPYLIPAPGRINALPKSAHGRQKASRPTGFSPPGPATLRRPAETSWPATSTDDRTKDKPPGTFLWVEDARELGLRVVRTANGPPHKGAVFCCAEAKLWNARSTWKRETD